MSPCRRTKQYQAAVVCVKYRLCRLEELTYHMEFLHLCIMFNQKSQNVTMTDDGVIILFSQEKFTLSDCFFGILRVNSSREQKVTGNNGRGEHSACMGKPGKVYFYCHVS